MKLLFFLITIFIFLSIAVNAQEIKVNVIETLKIEALGLKYNSSIENGEPLKISFEVFNTGSVGYKTRVRLDIYKQKELIQTLWSNEEDFIPGVIHHFDIYYPTTQVGNFKAELKFFFANEIKELKSFNFQVKKVTLHENIFDIKEIETYENEIELKIISNKTLENVLIIPTNCPIGWICEQTKIEKINSNELSQINLPYESNLWRDSDITFNILTEDGKYITTKSFTLKKVGNFKQFLHDTPRLLKKYFPIIVNIIHI